MLHELTLISKAWPSAVSQSCAVASNAQTFGKGHTTALTASIALQA